MCSIFQDQRSKVFFCGHHNATRYSVQLAPGRLSSDRDREVKVNISSFPMPLILRNVFYLVYIL